MIRHKKPGHMHTRTHACAHTEPPFPLFTKHGGGEGLSPLSPPLSQVSCRHLPHPTSSPPSDQRGCSRHQGARANTDKAGEAETYSKDTPGTLPAPSHTTTTQGGSGEQGRLSILIKMIPGTPPPKKKERRKASKAPLRSRHRQSSVGGRWGQSRQSDDSFLPILSASKSLAGLGLPPDSGFAPPGSSSACRQLARPLAWVLGDALLLPPF